MIDSAVRILSLANQLDFCTRRVRLDFVEGERGALDYLNQMGFFATSSLRLDAAGTKLLTTVLRSQSDIWMMEGFDR